VVTLPFAFPGVAVRRYLCKTETNAACRSGEKNRNQYQCVGRSTIIIASEIHLNLFPFRSRPKESEVTPSGSKGQSQREIPRKNKILCCNLEKKALLNTIISFRDRARGAGEAPAAVMLGAAKKS
jgi:hypothetical protein